MVFRSTQGFVEDEVEPTSDERQRLVYQGSDLHAKMTGDSLTNDILPLLDLGAAHGVWLLRDGASAVAGSWSHPRVTVASSLDAQEVWNVFSA